MEGNQEFGFRCPKLEVHTRQPSGDLEKGSVVHRFSGEVWAGEINLEVISSKDPWTFRDQ